VKRELDITVSRGGFKKLRELNRKRNYLIKDAKLNLKIFIAKIKWDSHRKNAFDISKVKTVLLIRNEGTIGDIVVTTPLIKSLNNKGFNVDILVTRKSAIALKYNKHVRNIYEADDCNHQTFLKEYNHTVPVDTINALRNNAYDLVIDLCLFDIPVHRMKLYYDINAKCVAGFNKWNCINRYSLSIPFKNGKDHVTKAITAMAEALDVDNYSRSPYDLDLPEKYVNDVKEYFNTLAGKKIVINYLTGSSERDFSQQQVSGIIRLINEHYPDVSIVIIDRYKQLDIPLPENAVLNPFNTLHHVMALIYSADVVISPDTSIVHIAAAWEKTLVSVYKNVTDNNDLWGPEYNNASQIILNVRKLANAPELPERVMKELNTLYPPKNQLKTNPQQARTAWQAELFDGRFQEHRKGLKA